jgi:hypothetical protein
VQTTVALFCAVYAGDDGFILVKLFLLDGDIDLDDVLPDNATSANVEMPVLQISCPESYNTMLHPRKHAF